MKLNGWKRIGIVASVAWMLGGYLHEFDVRSDDDSKIAEMIEDNCISDQHGQETPDNHFLKKEQDYLNNSFASERDDALFVAFVPIPLAWGFAYLLIFIVRWIKRGFSPVPPVT
jgi:hypothetical protein